MSVDSITEVLWWLPEDTETVSVARGPFKAPQISEPSANISPSEYVEYALTASSLSLIHLIWDGSLYKSIVGSTVKFCVEGSRRFREPKSLGSMLYEGCSITVLESGMIPSRSALVNQMTQGANQVQTIAGQRVMMFEKKLEDDLWKIYVAVPESNILLCATNQDFLIQVLNRMQHRADKRALQEDLPEWKQVNTGARFWAVRHYDRTAASRDPSSPVSGKQRAANWPDTEAVGIVLDFDPDRSKVVTVRYLSGNKDALKLFSAQHTKIGQGFKPVISLRELGVVEMKVSCESEEEVGISLLVLFSLLGHGVYV
ncbi:MAG TPA: hypothetical protein VI837_10235 [Blastocatellia bacterium]|nr:hypothetical protein [Blastocatellia bacterium]